MYKILFNKDASTDPDGVNYWVNEITSGKMDLGTAIVTLEKAAEEYLNSDDAAVKAAAETFVNRAAAAVKIADTLPSADVNGDGKVTAAEFKVFQNSVKVVTDDSSTIDKAVETAQAEYKETIQELPPAKTFVLTNSNNQITGGVDNIVGTDGNDLIIGTATGAGTDTYQTGDIIDGKGGYDTFQLLAGTNIVPSSIKNVEDIKIQATGATTLQASSIEASDLGTTFESNYSTSNVTINNVKSTDGYNFKLANTQNVMNVTFDPAAVNGTDDNVNLTVENAGIKGNTAQFAVDGAESITIYSTGTAKNYVDIDSGSDNVAGFSTTAGSADTSILKTVKVTGDQGDIPKILCLRNYNINFFHSIASSNLETNI